MDIINIKIGDLELRNNFKGEQLQSMRMEIDAQIVLIWSSKWSF